MYSTRRKRPAELAGAPAVGEEVRALRNAARAARIAVKQAAKGVAARFTAVRPAGRPKGTKNKVSAGAVQGTERAALY